MHRRALSAVLTAAVFSWTVAAAHAATPQSTAAASAHDLVASRPAALHASSADKFAAQDVITSGEGLHYVPYQRTYKSLPVVGGDFVVVTTPDGHVTSTSVAQRATIDVSTVPALTRAQAEQSALSASSADDPQVASTDLVVDAQLDTPALAYESVVTGHRGEIPSRLRVLVDANSGAVLSTREEVAEGTGTGWINGPTPLSIATTLSGSTYLMRDPLLSNVSCQNSTTHITFTGPDDVWGNGDGTNLETACVDSLFAVQRESAMLKSWYGRNSMNGAGGGVPLRVGLASVNAYYDGSQVQIGHNTAGRWLSSIDVVAHEFGHEIDDTTPGGPSGGGVGEGIGDTFGALTEAYANEAAAYDPPDYSVGEEINLDGGGPVRYMYDPSLVGDPNCYSSTVPSMEVHSAAGPFDHWFYLLAEGSNPANGQPQSPTCNGSALSGLGARAAGAIVYNAMLMKTSGSSYLKYRTWTLTAAKNLTPGACTQFNAVKAAWNAVSVPAQAADPTCTGVAINDPGPQATKIGVSKSVQMTTTGGTAPYSWTATLLPPGMTINASTGLISGTPGTVGIYHPQVTVVSNGHSSSLSFTFTVSTSSCVAGQKLINPGFESGTTAWTTTTGVITNSPDELPHAGSYKAWLDGYGTARTDTLQQTVTIPAGCTNSTLSFWLHIDSAEITTTSQYDKLTVSVGGTTVVTYSNLNKASGYQLRTFNVGAFAGQAVAIKFSGSEDASLQTSFVIDDTALNAQ
jgi:Zn-dependent metalloprotease